MLGNAPRWSATGSVCDQKVTAEAAMVRRLTGASSMEEELNGSGESRYDLAVVRNPSTEMPFRHLGAYAFLQEYRRDPRFMRALDGLTACYAFDERRQNAYGKLMDDCIAATNLWRDSVPGERPDEILLSAEMQSRASRGIPPG